jgi:UDP-N-acetylmuramoyl-tripeptide--D-alanyl-D-alanine ligase
MSETDFLLALPWIVASILYSWHLLLFFQQEEYDIRRYLRWWFAHLKSIVPKLPLGLCLAAIIMLVLGTQVALMPIVIKLVVLILGTVSMLWSIIQIRKPAKLSLKYTPRLIRLILSQSSLIFLLSAGGFWASRSISHSPSWLLSIWFSISLVVYLLSPLWNCIANLTNAPLESLARKSYYLAAMKKSRSFKPAVIGITGSYGKTSTKDILAHILSASKKTLPTPKSYNTLMGVTRVINDSLKKDHEVFLVEMGAYKTHEIDDISQLVKPALGILTAIGPQHLERFGTVENVAKAKFELFQSLPAGGTAIFNMDDDNIRKNFPQLINPRLVSVSASGNSCADIFATEITISSMGLSFLINDTLRKKQVQCQVCLLGRHNITNILLAVAAAQEFGLNLEMIKERLKTLAPTPHRLQLIKRPDGINIIDDSYNSNPVGVRMALETLTLFSGGNKILVTPGMIELGPIEERENYQLGVLAASICDHIILVGGEHTRPIYNGILSTSYNKDNVYQTKTFTGALAEINRISRSGDTILLLNDLPDLYESF